MEDESDTSCNWCTWNIPEGLLKRLEELEIRGGVKTIQTIIKIGQNTEESAEDLRRLIVI